MTRILLIRHATGPHIGRTLIGRSPGHHLPEAGRAEAERLAERLAGRGVGAVYASPLERARETAEPLARRLGLPVQEAPGLIELDFGEWTGRAIADLEGDERWRHFNSHRSGTRIPGGELFLEVQLRAWAELQRLRGLHPETTVAAVTHADVIRAVLAHAAAIPVDLLLRFEVSPVSVTELELHDWGPRVVCVNERG